MDVTDIIEQWRLQGGATEFGWIEGETAVEVVASILKQVRAERVTWMKDANAYTGWTPTAANVNALPAPVRDYIHQIEARADPSGDRQELVLARETCKALEQQLAEMRHQLRPAKGDAD